MVHSTEPVIQINVNELPFTTFAEFKQVYFTKLPGKDVNQIPGKGQNVSEFQKNFQNF